MPFRKLLVYQKGFSMAQDVYELTKNFPKEETYSLTDQIRRSSSSICSNFAERYRKRRYPKHFISKLSDADSENAETLSWLEFALSCKYISGSQKNDLESKSLEIGKLLQYMMTNPEKFQ